MLCIKVPKEKGERVRNKLLEKNLLMKKAKIKTEEDHIFLPLKEHLGEDMLESLDLEYPILDREFEVREKTVKDYRTHVDVPGDLEKYLPSSYDIIGDIATLKIPDEVEEYKNDIGEAVLKTHKNVETVLKDEGVEGEFRVRDVSHLAGEKRTETIHREYGVELELDISKTYFSPRLATERWKVTNKVNKGERIFDMFAGVGPFTILIGKNADVGSINSVDKNPDAVKYLRKNVDRNGLKELVTIYNSDVREVYTKMTADRVIMNLPHSSFEFIDCALGSIGNKGVIHYYEIMDKDDERSRREDILEKIRESGYDADIKEKRLVKSYSATMDHMAYDIEIKKIP